MALAQPRDLEQSLALGRRRHNELCRQKRIFDARSRIIGVRSPGPGGACGEAAREAGGGTAEANPRPGAAGPGAAASRAAGAGEDWLVVPTAAEGGKGLRRPDAARSHPPERRPEPCSREGLAGPGGSAEAGARGSPFSEPDFLRRRGRLPVHPSDKCRWPSCLVASLSWSQETGNRAIPAWPCRVHGPRRRGEAGVVT